MEIKKNIYDKNWDGIIVNGYSDSQLVGEFLFFLRKIKMSI